MGVEEPGIQRAVTRKDSTRYYLVYYTYVNTVTPIAYGILLADQIGSMIAV